MVAHLLSLVLPLAVSVPNVRGCATDLRLNYLTEPLGVDRTLARFTWVPPAVRGWRQSGARVVITEALNGTVAFDSGFVATLQPTLANTPPMPPLALASDTAYAWQLQLWTVEPPAAATCVARSTFTSGIMEGGWAAAGARWIRAGANRTQMRKEFTVPAVPRGVARATLFVAACQYHALFLDGKPVGEQRLAGPWTEFYLNRSYIAYDVSPARLTPGAHALGLRVGQGFCANVGHDGYDTAAERSAIVLLQLHATRGGVVLRVASDGTWTAGGGPILRDSTYYGELYDAREEQDGWSAPGFTPPAGAAAWMPVDTSLNVVAALHAEAMPPVTVVRELPAVGFRKIIVNTSYTAYVYDFGQEFAGVVRFTLPIGTPRGTRATLQHAEALNHPPFAARDGRVWMGNLFWANPVDVYIARGAATAEVYTPSFTYHGFRYVELSLELPVGAAPASAEPGPGSLVGVNLRSAVREVAALELGSDVGAPNNLLQRLSNNSWWTEAAALMSIPAGAAGRGERNGWTGDAAFAVETESFDFDTGAFFARYLAQVRDAQALNGELGSGVPDQGSHPTTHHHPQTTPMDPDWSAVFPAVAHALWKYYNCTECIDAAWSGLSLYYRMLETNYSVSATTFGRWGDWNAASDEMENPWVPGAKGGLFKNTWSSITAAAMVVQNLGSSRGFFFSEGGICNW